MMGKFRRTLDDCELLELSLQNRRYTWSNDQQNPTLVRLDRVFCNPEWEVKKKLRLERSFDGSF
jgi:hypothetical protein